MHHARSLAAALAMLALAVPALVQAGATRVSAQQMPQAGGAEGCSGQGKAACESARREDRGPPAGFPHSPGLENARHHADCHAAFQQCDSPGG